LTTTSPLTAAVRADVPENVEVPEKLSPGVEAPDDDSVRAMVKLFA